MVVGKSTDNLPYLGFITLHLHGVSSYLISLVLVGA